VKIYLGSDHAGFDLRGKLVQHLAGRPDVEVDDRGPATLDPNDDYPEEAAKVARLVRDDPGSRGIIVCGSGVGVCIAANKIQGIRAANVVDVDSARVSRSHNDANVLCIGERTTPERDALALVDAWLTTAFEGGRHARRVAQIAAIDDQEHRAAEPPVVTPPRRT